MTGQRNDTVDGVQVLGLCRFSAPTIGGFQSTPSDLEALRRVLYDPARLAYRFAWFENMLLPSIAGQRDPDFTLIVMLGEDFPQPWRSRMEAHAKRMPQLALEYVPPQRHRALCRDVVAKYSNPDAEVIAQFRMDDDDAVAISFVRQLREEFDGLRGFFDSQEMVAIDYGRGVIVEDISGRLKLIPLICHFWTAAMAMYTRPGDGNHILEGTHNTCWQRMTTISQVDEYMFLRGEHQMQDSSGRLPFVKLKLPKEELVGVIQRRFLVNLGKLLRALAEAQMPEKRSF